MTYYIDYKENGQKKSLKRIVDKMFYRFSVINIDNNKECIYINKKYINQSAYKKINKYLIKHNLDILKSNALIVKDIEIIECINHIKYVPREKYVMKANLQGILDYIEKVLNIDLRNECVHLTMQDENNKEILIGILDWFKCINIATTRIGYMRRLEKSIVNRNDAVISISNNKRKALKRAKILINLDFDNELINEFCINRNCLIINLKNSQICLKSSFQGSIIDSIQIDFKNRYRDYINKDKYDKVNLYNSFIQDFSYKDAVNCIESDNCKIMDLIGIRGIIPNDEIINNYTNSSIKLDKTRKMD
ncbi:MAG: hypothetical protein IKE91_01145 [Clostridia bacterium]|nr:hypothetical protein [Clostridia bacterium]